MAVFYYTRISTAAQFEGRQIENFKSLGDFNPSNVYIDKVSGNIPFIQREQASKMFDVITSNQEELHTVVVDSVDRIGRNMLDILGTIELFNKNRINIKSIKEGFETITNGEENAVAKMTVSLMASIAEFEKTRLVQRTSEGVLLAKAAGKFKGRRLGTKMSDNNLVSRYPVVVAKLKKGWTVREISERTGNSSATIIKVKKVLVKWGEL